MADLKPRQYKRLGRIQENNPQRAARVAERMEKRASREERGKEVAKASSRGMAVGIAKMRGEENPRARANAVQQYRASSENTKPVNTVRGKVNRPDTPLADSPVPSFFKSK
jgi:hypothetical protein